MIGTTKFAYDLWGETVNLASRLESSGEPGRIHISDTFKAGIGDSMTCVERGEITIKGVGLTRTHWLVGHNSGRIGSTSAPYSLNPLTTRRQSPLILV